MHINYVLKRINTYLVKINNIKHVLCIYENDKMHIKYISIIDGKYDVM